MTPATTSKPSGDGKPVSADHEEHPAVRRAREVFAETGPELTPWDPNEALTWEDGEFNWGLVMEAYEERYASSEYEYPYTKNPGRLRLFVEAHVDVPYERIGEVFDELVSDLASSGEFEVFDTAHVAYAVLGPVQEWMRRMRVTNEALIPSSD